MKANRTAVSPRANRSNGRCSKVSYRSLVYLAALLALTGSFSVHARGAWQEAQQVDDSAEIGLRPAYTKCVSGGEMTTAGMLACAHDEFGYQDRRLNVAYKAVMSALPPGDKVVLRNDERRWLEAKKARCALHEDAGTTDQVMAADCEVDQTARRAMYLESRLHK